MELSLRQIFFCKIDQMQLVCEMRIFDYCMPCLRATSKQKDDRTTVYCCTQYAPLLGVLGRSALGSLGLSGLWHLTSRITDRTHSSVVIRRVPILYYVISIMFQKFMWLNRKTLATINHEPDPCFFIVSPIYTSRAWPVLFTFISIDVPRLYHPWFLVREDENWCAGT